MDSLQRALYNNMWLDLLIWYFMFFSMLKEDGTLFC